MKIATGQKAPAFGLYNSEREKVTTESLKGKNFVLLFFPAAFTSVCTKELCHVRDNISRYNTINAEVFGISVDSIFTLAKFKTDQQLNFQLLSDFNKEVSTAYGVLIPDFMYDMHGVSKRAAFVIDKEGIIQYEEVLDQVRDLPDFEAIELKIAELK